MRFFLLLLSVATSLTASIDSALLLNATPQRFERLDFDVVLRAEWSNPYRSADVALDLQLTAPSGRTLVVPAFYVSGESGAPSVWAARFTPVETGTYQGTFVVKDAKGSRASSPLSFTVKPSARKGFLRSRDLWTFRYDDGTPFRAVGENLCWEARSFDDSRYFRALHEHPRFHYEYLLGRLSENGGNFFRTWMCPWNLPVEWPVVRDTQRYQNDSGPFNRSAFRRMDELVELSDRLGLHFMLTLDSAGNFLGGDWKLHPYNRVNGGPLDQSAGFFTDPAAKERYRDRLRLIVARWGYSPSVAAWEFFNEVDNLTYGHEQKIPDAVAVAWHDEMSRYLRNLDPYGHLITTSISHRDLAGLNDLPAVDFNQKHVYGHTGTIPETLTKESLEHRKPYVIGEYSYEWDWSKNFNDFAGEMDHDFRRGLWLGLFAPTPVLPLSWWWEYFDERGRLQDMKPVRRVLDDMLHSGGGNFEALSSSSGTANVTSLAVLCGTTRYLLLLNESSSPAIAAPTVGGETPKRTALERFDTKTLAWTSAETRPTLEVPAKGELLLRWSLVP